MICEKKLFLFDIDGVIRLGDNLIDGALELCEYIDKIGGKSIFITNNSTKSAIDYVQLFHNYGFKVDESNFITALTVSKIYLKNNFSDQLIYAWGTQSFIKELKSSGLKITTDKNDYDKIKCIIVGYNNEMTYSSVCEICEVLQKTSVPYFATNTDWICPVSYGFIPDCGAICKFIEQPTGKSPIYLGKPEPNMVEIALKENPQYSKSDCVVVGDRLYTDIACGINAGVDSCVVFTGEAKKEDILTTEFKPTYQYQSVKEILIAMKNK